MAKKQEETGWLIERHVYSTLYFWAGLPDKDGFREDANLAVRFCREEDASRVLSSICGGMGRVAEHKWLENKAANTKQLEAMCTGQSDCLCIKCY